ncbi:MAG: hypothetical protein AAF664_14590, partial [Planctomycetota bacterium]
LERRTAIYSYDIGSSFDAAETAVVSPNGKYIALENDDDVYLVETLSGELHGRFSPPDGVDRMAFSPDGLRIAGYNSRTAWAWDLQSNELLWGVDFVDVNSDQHHRAIWTSNDYLIMKGKVLVDATSGDIVWRFEKEVDQGKKPHHSNRRCRQWFELDSEL